MQLIISAVWPPVPFIFVHLCRFCGTVELSISLSGNIIINYKRRMLLVVAQLLKCIVIPVYWETNTFFQQDPFLNQSYYYNFESR